MRQSRLPEILGGVVGGEIAVGGGIPLAVVDAVENAVQVGGAPAQDGIEAPAEFRRLNLLGIFLAHRGELIGEDDAGFEEVELIVLLHLVHGEDIPREEKLLGRGRRKRALIRSIVDGEHGGGAAQQRVSRIGGAQVERDESRLPIVDVEDVGDAELLGGFQYGAAEEAEAFGVVRVVAAG